jgi:predicted transcriptional regulator
VVQTPIRFKKGIALELRKKGLSYSEIQNSINLPRSTIAYWLKGIQLSEEQAEKLKEKRSRVAKSNVEKRISRILHETEDIKKSAAKEIGGITKRELWLMGIMLYWRERFLLGNDNDLRKGIRFTSSDPDLIKLFLKWLQEIGRIDDEEIAFDIFTGKDKKDNINDVKNRWSVVTGFSRGHFPRVYFLKSGPKGQHGKKRKTKRSEWGMLRIRVKASSMLARQMAGWISGIQKRFMDK